MSRRESRVSINVRQNDALNEFENFKKKFLLANKHITKLNSTLSVRIEELNAQISTLYVENLRLRASEIALSAQLQREREKSWRIMTDAETATHNLSKHLGHMRKSYNISQSLPSPPQQPPAPPRTRRPMPDPAASPQTTRLSRPPNVPGIYEDDEEGEVDTSPEETERLPSPTIRRKMKARLSASRLPLPSRVSSPPPTAPPPLFIESKGRKKSSRRQSGLLKVDTARPPSPAYGSPIQKLAQEVQEEEGGYDEDIAVTDEMNVDAELEAALRRESKGKSKEREREGDGEVVGESSRPRERKRRRDNEEGSSTTTTNNSDGAKTLKDVTNSPRGRAALPPLDTNTSDRERQWTPETEPTTAISAAPSSLLPFPSTESTPATTPAQTAYPLSDPDPSTYLPTPRQSSSPPPPTSASETEGGSGAVLNGGRATRMRKSVNYAEPKLNTKMRKPDSESGSTGTKKRSSMSAKSLAQSQPLPVEGPSLHPSFETTLQRPKTPKKKSSASTNPQNPPPLPIDDTEPRSSFETVPAPPSRNHTQPQEIKSRPASVSPTPHPYSQVQALPPRPASRPSSSSTSTSFRPISSSHAHVTTTPGPNSSAAATTVKRKKSRPYVDPDDYESDGAQADAEFGGSGLTNGWVNIEGRRKSILHGLGATGSSRERERERERNGGRMLDVEEGRRHSMAV